MNLYDLRAPSFRLFSGERVGHHQTSRTKSHGRFSRSLTPNICTISVPHPFAFFLAKGWETTQSQGAKAHGRFSRSLTTRICTISVPHPFAFFLAKGWETTQSQATKSPGRRPGGLPARFPISWLLPEPGKNPVDLAAQASGSLTRGRMTAATPMYGEAPRIWYPDSSD